MCQPNTAIRRKFSSKSPNSRYFLNIMWISESISGPTVSTISPHLYSLHFSQSRPESDRNSRWPNSNSSQPNSIYSFKNLTYETRIWIWSPRISVRFWPGLAEVEAVKVGRNCGDSWTWYWLRNSHYIQKIPWIRRFGAEFSANGCIWLAHSISTVAWHLVFEDTAGLIKIFKNTQFFGNQLNLPLDRTFLILFSSNSE